MDETLNGNLLQFELSLCEEILGLPGMLILIKLKTVIILEFPDQYLLAGGFFLTKMDTAITAQWQKVRDKKGIF